MGYYHQLEGSTTCSWKFYLNLSYLSMWQTRIDLNFHQSQIRHITGLLLVSLHKISKNSIAILSFSIFPKVHLVTKCTSFGNRNTY